MEFETPVTFSTVIIIINIRYHRSVCEISGSIPQKYVGPLQTCNICSDIILVYCTK